MVVLMVLRESSLIREQNDRMRAKPKKDSEDKENKPSWFSS